MSEAETQPEEIRTLSSLTRCNVYGQWPSLRIYTASPIDCVLLDDKGELAFQARLTVTIGPELAKLSDKPVDNEIIYGDSITEVKLQSAFFRGSLAVLEWTEGEPFCEFISSGLKPGQMDLKIEFKSNDNVRLASDLSYLSAIGEIVAYQISRSTGDIIVPQSTRQVHAIYNSKILGLMPVSPKEAIKILKRPKFDLDDLSFITDKTSVRIGLLSKRVVDRVGLAVRRVNSGLSDSDPVDAFCDFWEACEFLAPKEPPFVGACAELIAAYLAYHILPAGSGNARKKLQCKIKTLATQPMHQLRGSIVHHLGEGSGNLSNSLGIVEEMAILLLDYWTGNEFTTATRLSSLGIFEA